MALGDVVSTNFNMAQEANILFAQANHGEAREKLEEIRDFLNEEIPAETEDVTETETPESQ